MKRKTIISILIISLFTYSYCLPQEQLFYKQIDTTKLFMEVYNPKKMDLAKKYPEMIIFFGGGWNGGSIQQFEPQTNYISQRGMIFVFIGLFFALNWIVLFFKFIFSIFNLFTSIGLKKL